MNARDRSTSAVRLADRPAVEERHVVRAPAGARIFACPHRNCRGRIDLSASDPRGVGGEFAASCSSGHPVLLDLLPNKDATPGRQTFALLQ
jgi:hypothetical protein